MTTYLVVVEVVMREVLIVEGAESEEHARRAVTDEGCAPPLWIDTCISEPITHPLIRHIVLDDDATSTARLMREQHERDGLKWAHETEVVRYTGGNE